jgi:hypothetical protein
MDVGLFMERREAPPANGARFECRDPISHVVVSTPAANKGLSGHRQRSGGICFPRPKGRNLFLRRQEGNGNCAATRIRLLPHQWTDRL